MLHHEDYMPYAPDYAGQVRHNHTSNGCSGGRDSMKIVRHDDDSVYAVCYRCGEWGKYTPDFAVARAHLNRDVKKEMTSQGYKLPTDLTSKVSEWSMEARVWILRAITQEEVEVYGIMYSPSKDILVLPIDKDNYYVRLFSNPLYKYISNCKTKNIYKYTNKTSKVVIVEDYLSYIKISRYYSCLCIFGTNLYDNHIATLIANHSNFVIFLDNDNETVRKKQREMHDTLSMMGTCRTIKHDKDPKYCTEKELKELIR